MKNILISMTTTSMLTASFVFASPPADTVAIELVDDTQITLTATWDPITDTVYKLQDKFEELQDLTPAHHHVTYGAAALRKLLPDHPVKLGEIWRLEDGAILTFLRQFNETATTSLHHSTGAGGGYAMVRGIGPSDVEIMIRIHVEFIIARTEHGPTFLTPGQFEGRLLVRDGKVAEFDLRVPPTNPNVDVNVSALHNGNSVMWADIGFIPEMSLSSRSKEQVAAELTREISLEDARIQIAQKFYRCAAIGWTDAATALQLARDTGRPIHVVSLFGALVDESCCGSGKTLRGNALSRPDVVGLLSDQFINVWLIGKDLPTLAEQATDPDLKRMYQTLSDNYDYPVDTVVLDASGELIAHVNVKQVAPLGPVNYLTFLNDALKSVHSK